MRKEWVEGLGTGRKKRTDWGGEETGDKGVLVEAIKQISDMATQIASAAEEQSLVTSDISSNSESVREVSDHLANDAQDAVIQAQELHRLANELGQEISRFKL